MVYSKYVQIDEGKKFVIDSSMKYKAIIKEGKVDKFDFEQISLVKKSTPFFSPIFSDLYYFEIKLVDGRQYFLTSLTAKRLIINDVKYFVEYEEWPVP